MRSKKIYHSESSEGGGETPSKGDDNSIKWDELKKINKEIVGWIQIKDTKIDYPVLWHKGDDITDQFYLNHNYKGDYDSYGCIFLDYRCTKGMDSKNIVLHGHHMNDGSMFGELMNYGGTEADMDFYKKHATIKFDTPQGDGVYKIISVYKTNTLSAHGEFFNYMVGNFQNDKDFMNYVYNVRIRSLINCPVDVNEDDELLTLSTCSYEYTNFRTVVVARRVRIGEDSKVDVKKGEQKRKTPYGLRFTTPAAAAQDLRSRTSAQLTRKSRSTGTTAITTSRIRRFRFPQPLRQAPIKRNPQAAPQALPSR